MDLSIISDYFESENKMQLTKNEVLESRRNCFLKVRDQFITTDDGALSLKFKDTMHSHVGALKERLHAYTIPSKIQERKRLLDICSGFGYNALYAIYTNPKLSVDMVEKFWEISAVSLIIPLPENYSFLDASFDRIKGSVENKLFEMGKIKNCAYENDPNIRLHIGEAQSILSQMDEKFDVIFFDPDRKSVV